MAQWLQAQLNVATNLLESVDRTISKTVGIPDTSEGESASDTRNFQGTQDGTLLPQSYSATGDTPLPASAAPDLAAAFSHTTPFTIKQSGPFDAAPERHTGPSQAPQPATTSTYTEPWAAQPLVPAAAPHADILSKRSVDATNPAAGPAASAPPASIAAGVSSLVAGTHSPLYPGPTPAPAQVPPPSFTAFGSSKPGSHHERTTSVPVIHNTAPATAAVPAVPKAAAPTPQQSESQAPVPGSSASFTAASSSSQAVGGGAAKLVEQLRKRLEVASAENEQLEEMLKKEEQRAEAEAAAARKMAEELSALQDARAQAEAALQSQLAAQQVMTRDLSSKLEASNRQVLKLEAQVTALQETTKQLAETRSGLEGGMLEALKSQLESAEQRLDAERRANHTSKVAAQARESELEVQLAGSAAALADMQRALEEAGMKSRDLEDQVALLQATCKQLEQQQQLAGGLVGPGSTGGALNEGVDAALLSALRADLSQQQRACQAAETGRKAAEAALSQLKVEAEGLRAELEKHAARGDVAQLEVRLREVSDMLYLKQEQLERLASDKAAQQLRLERELALAREQAAGSARYHVDSGSGGGRGSGGDELIPMDALGAPYQRLAQHNRVGKAVKVAARFLDSTASSAVFFLRQYPLARIIIFAYLVLLHLYMYYLLARLQGMAVRMEGVADGMGSLPGHAAGAVGHGVAATRLHPPP